MTPRHLINAINDSHKKIIILFSFLFDITLPMVLLYGNFPIYIQTIEEKYQYILVLLGQGHLTQKHSFGGNCHFFIFHNTYVNVISSDPEL